MAKDICAGIPYTDRNGEKRTRWVRVGRLITTREGGLCINFEKHINPAGFANDKGEVWFSVFEPKTKEEDIV